MKTKFHPNMKTKIKMFICSKKAILNSQWEERLEAGDEPDAISPLIWGSFVFARKGTTCALYVTLSFRSKTFSHKEYMSLSYFDAEEYFLKWDTCV